MSKDDEPVVVQCTVKQLIERNQEMHRTIQQYESVIEKMTKQYRTVEHQVQRLEEVVSQLLELKRSEQKK